MVIEPPLCQRPGVCFRDLEVSAPEKVRDRAVVDTTQLHHQARVAWPAPLDLALHAVKGQGCPCVETFGEVCQGNYLYSSVQTVGSSHLSDPDHSAAPSADDRLPLGS